MTIILDGRAASHAIRTWTAESVKSLKEKHGWTPVLVTVQIGDNPASERYVRNQIKACHDVGISARLEKFPADTEKCEFLKTVLRNCQFKIFSTYPQQSFRLPLL